MNSSLEQLYPGLKPRERVDDADLLASIAAKANDSIRAKEKFFADHAEGLVSMAKAVAHVFENEGRLLTMGNGGSASDAAHVAVEFNHPVTVGRPALPAIMLGADPQFATAIGNDVGFDQIFARQVIAWGRKGDALLGLSTSGNSKNLLEAFRVAKSRGMVTLGLSGDDGGRMKDVVDHCLVVETPSIHRIQECHLLAYHVLWDLVHTLLAQSRGER